MHQSLHKLMQLPDDTVVYCTHEYTLANLAFAQQVEPHNNELLKHLAWARTQREKGLPTVPSTLAIEKAINPFLRAHEDGIKRNVEQQVGKQLSDDDAVFKAIRQWKDHF
jgi:hydroxyacylglutathione hydrolase